MELQRHKIKLQRNKMHNILQESLLNETDDITFEYQTIAKQTNQQETSNLL